MLAVLNKTNASIRKMLTNTHYIRSPEPQIRTLDTVPARHSYIRSLLDMIFAKENPPCWRVIVPLFREIRRGYDKTQPSYISEPN